MRFDHTALLVIGEDLLVVDGGVVHLHDAVDPVDARGQYQDQVVVLAVDDFAVVSYLPAPSDSGCHGSQVSASGVHGR